MGFEALLLGKEVHCFGMPFYAGWGATHDRLTCPRRAKRRTAEEIFAAAYMLYARYVNPVAARRCDIHEAIRILAAQRFQNERNKGFHAGCWLFQMETSSCPGPFAIDHGNPSVFFLIGGKPSNGRKQTAAMSWYGRPNAQ